MSKSLPVLIDTTNAQLKTATTPLPMSTTSPLPKFMPTHDFSHPQQVHSSAEIQVEKFATSEQPHSSGTSVETERQPIIDTTTSRTNNLYNHNNERHPDNAQNTIEYELPAAARTQQHRNYEITTKSYSVQQLILGDNRINDVVVISPNDKHSDDTQITYRMSSKFTKSMEHHQRPSHATLLHPAMRSIFYTLSILIVIVILVIYVIVAIRKRRKIDAHCDKTNLISNNASTTSINDCGMDFNHDTTSTCIAYTTVIHV